MTQDTSVCRFCLEPSNTKRNPLVDPCDCRGSVQFVHERCLSKWRRLDPARNAESCLICLTPYHLKNLTTLEQIPDENKLRIFFLRFPIASCMVVNYFMVFQMSIDRKKPFFDLFESYQYLFQLLYLFLFYLEWNVRNKALYWKSWKNLSSATLFALYVAANVLLHHGHYIMIFPINLFLAVTWQNHRRILIHMNED